MKELHVLIHWTETAHKVLLDLPKDPGLGLFNKVDSLRESDPRLAGKPLVGPLQGYRSLTYGRYRAVFSVEEEEITSHDVRITVYVQVVYVGIRKERDKKDVYKMAMKLVELGIIPTNG